MRFLTTNTILYCRKFEKTVRFYKDALGLPVLWVVDWFVEFALTTESRLSIADDQRATVRTANGAGVTLSLEVTDIEAVWEELDRMGLAPSPIREHPWQARVFNVFDPEGHRIEMWQRRTEDQP